MALKKSAKKKLVGFVDVTPTWRGVVPMLIVALENGTPEGKSIAREELFRLADIADAYVASQKKE